MLPYAYVARFIIVRMKIIVWADYLDRWVEEMAYEGPDMICFLKSSLSKNRKIRYPGQGCGSRKGGGLESVYKTRYKGTLLSSWIYLNLTFVRTSWPRFWWGSTGLMLPTHLWHIHCSIAVFCASQTNPSKKLVGCVQHNCTRKIFTTQRKNPYWPSQVIFCKAVSWGKGILKETQDCNPLIFAHFGQ